MQNVTLNPLSAIAQLVYAPFKSALKAYLRKAREDAFAEYKAEFAAELPDEKTQLALPPVEDEGDEGKAKRKK